jgi:hypothetical protein
VGGEGDVDEIVDVEPLQVAAHLLGHQHGLRHERERLIEVLEAKGLVDGVAAVGLAPPRQLGERRAPRNGRQFFRDCRPSSSAASTNVVVRRSDQVGGA